MLIAKSAGTDNVGLALTARTGVCAGIDKQIQIRDASTDMLRMAYTTANEITGTGYTAGGEAVTRRSLC
jgi:hypothetical protein